MGVLVGLVAAYWAFRESQLMRMNTVQAYIYVIVVFSVSATLSNMLFVQLIVIFAQVLQYAWVLLVLIPLGAGLYLYRRSGSGNQLPPWF